MSLYIKNNRDYFFSNATHCIFEVDLEYPTQLTNRNENYMLAPDTITNNQRITVKKRASSLPKYIAPPVIIVASWCSHLFRMITTFVIWHLIHFLHFTKSCTSKIPSSNQVNHVTIFCTLHQLQLLKRKNSKDDNIQKKTFTSI